MHVWWPRPRAWNRSGLFLLLSRSNSSKSPALSVDLASRHPLRPQHPPASASPAAEVQRPPQRTKAQRPVVPPTPFPDCTVLRSYDSVLKNLFLLNTRMLDTHVFCLPWITIRETAHLSFQGGGSVCDSGIAGRAGCTTHAQCALRAHLPLCVSDLLLPGPGPGPGPQCPVPSEGLCCWPEGSVQGTSHELPASTGVSGLMGGQGKP